MDRKYRVYEEFDFNTVLGLNFEWLNFFTNLTGQDLFEQTNYFLWYHTNFWVVWGHRHVYYMYNFTQKHLQPSHRSELCQNKHVFRKHQSWPDNFFPRWVPFFTIFTPLKWNGGLAWFTIIFNVHWGILGAIVSIILIPS